MVATIRITISLHGVFRIDRFKLQDREYPAGTTARAVIDDLDVSAALLGTVLINGIHADSEKLLFDGDTLMLLPLLEGG